MRVRVVFAGPVMAVLGSWFMRREFFKPFFVIIQQAVLGIIDKYGRRDVHGVDQAKSFLHSAFGDQPLNDVRDIYETPAVRYLKPKMFCKRFHVLNVRRRRPKENSQKST